MSFAKTMQKIEYFKVLSCFLFVSVRIRIQNVCQVPTRMLDMSHAKQKLLANNNNTMLKQRHMQTYTT